MVGTSLVGANNISKPQLSIIIELKQNKSVQGFLAENKTSGNFISTRATNFGGLWKSDIKIAKRHFLRIVGNSNLSYERFYTVITQIEGILNSRLICPLSNDPNDLNAPTRIHFLIVQPINMLSENYFTSLSWKSSPSSSTNYLDRTTFLDTLDHLVLPRPPVYVQNQHYHHINSVLSGVHRCSTKNRPRLPQSLQMSWSSGPSIVAEQWEREDVFNFCIQFLYIILVHSNK